MDQDQEPRERRDFPETWLWLDSNTRWWTGAMFYNAYTWGGHTPGARGQRDMWMSHFNILYMHSSYVYRRHASLCLFNRDSATAEFPLTVPDCITSCVATAFIMSADLGMGITEIPAEVITHTHASASLAPCKSLFLLYSMYSFVFSAQHVPGHLPVLESTCFHNLRQAAACGGHSLQLPGRGAWGCCPHCSQCRSQMSVWHSHFDIIYCNIFTNVILL